MERFVTVFPFLILQSLSSEVAGARIFPLAPYNAKKAFFNLSVEVAHCVPTILDLALAESCSKGLSDFTPMGEIDLHLFNEGTHSSLYEKLGAHPFVQDGVKGTHFAVWAPAAEKVSVVGDFNGWIPNSHPLYAKDQSGVWTGFIPNIGIGALYKFHVESRYNGYRVDKADPFAFAMELAPKTASKITSLDHRWADEKWMRDRGNKICQDAPVSIYEVHLGSWRRDPSNPSRILSCAEIAQPLTDHLLRLGFTHVEFLPFTEHPFYASWGYQVSNYFAPTSRYGEPRDFMKLIDHLHQNGIGVILDWVPSHFPNDQHGLSYFDGTHLFEHADPRQGFHPDWKSCIFNYGRHEIRAFLISSACFWLDKYHIDGLRVDAVASMIYLDYSRTDGEWIPNPHGGNENLDATGFLRQFNKEVYRRFPDVQTFAEESTSWSMVSRPVYLGGLGFGYKWDMGWMHDSLRYLGREPVHRKFHQNELSFRMLYAGQENFVLPLSHDEVVHGKASLVGKMPGDDWQKIANLRLLFAWQTAQLGKKLLFMGGEFAQWNEWNHDTSLDWNLTQFTPHGGMMNLVGDLNRLYRSEPALHRRDCDVTGLEWVDCSDSEASVFAFLRWGQEGERAVLAVFNFTPVPRHNYRVGVPFSETWKEVLNTDASWYGGSGIGNQGKKVADEMSWHNRPFSLELSLPPLAAVFFTPE